MIYTIQYKVDGYGGTFPKEGVVAVVADDEDDAKRKAAIVVGMRAEEAKFTIEKQEFSIVGDEPTPELKEEEAEEEQEEDSQQELAKRFLYENKITGWAVGKKVLFYATTIPPEMPPNEIIEQFNQWQESWKD